MRVLIATPLYPPEPGGPATYARILEEHLPGEGVEVSLVTFARVRRLPKLIRHMAYFWHVFKAAKNADVVLALDPVSTGLPARIAAFVRRKPFLVKIVGDYAWEQGRQRFGVSSSLDTFVHERTVPPQVSFLRFVQTAVARSAAAVIVPSEYLKRILCVWGVPKEQVAVIYNAVLPEEPSAIPESVAELARPRIVTAGRLVPWKGMGGVIDAVERLRSEFPEASLVIVGDGPDRAHLEAYAQARLSGGYVFTGAVSHQEALAVIEGADLFVLNSTYEGLSHLLIEALSLGVVTVATDVGGNPELITHEENGLLVPVREPGRLIEACQRALNDGTLRTKLSAAAATSMHRFSMETMTRQTAKLIHSIV